MPCMVRCRRARSTIEYIKVRLVLMLSEPNIGTVNGADTLSTYPTKAANCAGNERPWHISNNTTVYSFCLRSTIQRKDPTFKRLSEPVSAVKNWAASTPASPPQSVFGDSPPLAPCVDAPSVPDKQSAPLNHHCDSKRSLTSSLHISIPFERDCSLAPSASTRQKIAATRV